MKKKLLMSLGTVLLVMAVVAGAALAIDADAGTISTDFFVMGLRGDGGDTSVVADYWPAAGGASPDASIPRTLTGYGSYEFTINNSGLSDPWEGAAVVSANHPVAAAGEVKVSDGSASDGKRYGYYDARDAASDILFFPYVTYDEDGSDEIVQFSRMTIQNTGSSSTMIYLTYVDRDGATVAGSWTDTVPGNGTETYDTSVPGTGVPDLTATGYWTTNDSWTGGVIVTSTEQVLVGAHLMTWRGQSATYTALSSGGDKIYLTNIERKIYDATSNQTGGWNGMASIVVQNFDLTAGTNITVTFYSKQTGGSVSFNSSLPAGGAEGYNTKAGGDTPGGADFYATNLAFWDDTPDALNTDLGDWAVDKAMVWFGSAVIEADPGSNIAAVVFNRRHRQDTAAMYASATDADASYMIAFPFATRRKNQNPNRNSLFRIVAVESGTTTVYVSLFDQAGNLDLTWSGTTTQYSAVDGANLKNDTNFGSLTDTWDGAAVVTSTHKIVGTSEALWTHTDWMVYGAYNGYPVQ